MKKLLAIVLALSLFALSACASQDAKPSTETAAESSAEETATETETAAGQSETDASAEEGTDAADASEEDGVRRVAPLDEQLDVSQLTDAMMAASFDENGIEEKQNPPQS